MLARRLLTPITLLVACTSAPGQESDRRAKLEPVAVSEASAPKQCDVQALERAADEADVGPPRKRGDRMSAAVLAACRSVLPPSMRAFLVSAEQGPADLGALIAADPERLALEDRACPGSSQVLADQGEVGFAESKTLLHDRCDFARYDVLSVDEQPGTVMIFPWAIHQLLLDASVEAQLVRRVTRGLLIFERELFAPLQLGLDQELPAVALAGALSGSELQIVIETDAVRFGDATVAAILPDGRIESSALRGHLISKLTKLVSREVGRAQDDTGTPGRVLIVGDRRVEFQALVQVLFSAARGGATDFALAVETGPWQFGALDIGPTTHKEGDTADPNAALRVVIRADGFHFAAPGEMDRELPRDSDMWDLRGLEQLATEHKRAFPAQTDVTLAVESSISMGTLVDALIVLRGTKCSGEAGADCIFPGLLIEAATRAQ